MFHNKKNITRLVGAITFTGLIFSFLAMITGDAEAGCVNAKVKSWDVLWMRAGPGKKYRKTRSIPARACGVAIIGQCRAGWCKVKYGGAVGWTNIRYLDDNQGYQPPVQPVNNCQRWQQKCNGGIQWACNKWNQQQCGGYSGGGGGSPGFGGGGNSSKKFILRCQKLKTLCYQQGSDWGCRELSASGCP